VFDDDGVVFTGTFLRFQPMLDASCSYTYLERERETNEDDVGNGIRLSFFI